MVVLKMRDAATMQATAAANRGSTRLLEYLSCDGSLSGGGGAFVPDCRRSIIPRLYDLLLLSGWGLAGLIPRVYRCCFAFPSPVWSGRAARVEADALGPFGCEDVLSLCTPEAPGMSAGCRSDAQPRLCFGLLVCYSTLAAGARAARAF